MKSTANKSAAIAAIILSFIGAGAAHATEQNGKSLALNDMNSTNNAKPPQIGIGIGVQSGAASTAQSNAASSAKGGKATAKGGNAVSNAKGGKGGNASANQAQKLANAGNSSVNFEAPKIPVSSAIAAGLVASPGTCLGSASGAIQGSAIGLSFGSTVKDDGCHLIRRMVVLDQLGLSGAALMLACIEDDNIRQAVTAIGVSCQTGKVNPNWNVSSVNPIVPVSGYVAANQPQILAPKVDRN